MIYDKTFEIHFFVHKIERKAPLLPLHKFVTIVSSLVVHIPLFDHVRVRVEEIEILGLRTVSAFQ